MLERSPVSGNSCKPSVGSEAGVAASRRPGRLCTCRWLRVRNHLDLLGKARRRKTSGLRRFRGQREDCRKLAAQLDLEGAALGDETDLLDQRPDDLEGFVGLRNLPGPGALARS